MTPDEVRRVEFESARKGYRAEDVDDFLQHVAADMDKLMAERDAALRERDEAGQQRDAARQQKLVVEQEAAAARQAAEAKMYVLAEKVEEYRGQEDTLKTALINAQRMGETVVHEAKQKAEQMLREATGQAELLRQKAEGETARERETLENMLAEVNKFKSTVLNLYKQHIEALSALDGPTSRAEEVLKETVRYRVTEDVLPPADGTPMGSAEPELPAPAPAPADVPAPAPAAPAAPPAEAAPAPAYQQPPAFQPVNGGQEAALYDGSTMEYTVPQPPQP